MNFLPSSFSFRAVVYSAGTFFLIVSTSLVVGEETTPAPGNRPKLTASQRIDAMIDRQLAERKLQPNPPADDSVFVRRVYLDIIGRTPTRAETVHFLESDARNKRIQIIDDLLASDGYVSHHFNYWADLLRAKTELNGNGQSAPAGLAYGAWIKDSLRENKPYDQFVREMLVASGSSWDNGAVGYYIRDFGMPLDNLAITTQVFLGTQIVCAQCHNHPFDSWTQMDYYHLSAFTYGMVTSNVSENQRQALDVLPKGKQRIEAGERQEIQRAFSEILKPVRFNNVFATNRPLRLPTDYQYSDAEPRAPVSPAVPFAPGAAITSGENPIHAFADWMTSPENTRFTKVIANRLWKKAFGVGLIEPVDDLREDTVASNPELMEFLESRMIAFDFDMKKFLRMIYSTKAYQREASPREVQLGETYAFAGPVLRRMSAEQIWDSLVAMSEADVDEHDPAFTLETKRRLTEVELIAASLYDQKPDDFLKNAYEVASIQKELAAKLQGAQERLAIARESKDPLALKASQKESSEIRRQLAIQVEKAVFREGLEEKLALVATNESDGEALLVELSGILSSQAEGSRELTEGFDALIGDQNGVVRPLVKALLADDEARLRETAARQREQEMADWAIDTKEERESYRIFSILRSGSKRASEMKSPAPNGHFLREFGQSDREMVDNANHAASITQALALLNGPVIGAISNRYSVLGRDLSRVKGLSDRVDTIFLTMLNRTATDEEQQLLQQAWSESDGAASLQGLVWTVLNMREFLFIQ
jgi:hypothetical protein